MQKRVGLVPVEKKHFRKKKCIPKMSTVVHLKEVVYLSTKVSLKKNTNCTLKIGSIYTVYQITMPKNQKNRHTLYG